MVITLKLRIVVQRHEFLIGYKVGLSVDKKTYIFNDKHGFLVDYLGFIGDNY